MGVKKKEHRKKVQARNNKIKGETKRKQERLQEIFLKKLEAMKEDGTETQNITLNTDGFAQSHALYGNNGS